MKENLSRTGQVKTLLISTITQSWKGSREVRARTEKTLKDKTTKVVIFIINIKPKIRWKDVEEKPNVNKID